MAYSQLLRIVPSASTMASFTNEFVGGFVGSPSMNVLDAVVDTTESGVTLRGASTDFAYDLSPVFSDVLEGVEEVRMGIRPEDVRVADAGDPSIATTVDVVEPIGSDNYLYLDLGPEFIARVNSGITPDAGAGIEITFDERDVHLFDPRTGESLTHGVAVAGSDASTPAEAEPTAD
ncbi:TOBE domain-containing protein [Halobaculum rubrum]|uniref:TOBE domain-containing protein n=1 Tax=Halobaculum rubrum TaxID=2872158 RepID=UPI001CA447C7|nr:TOBE domain-containing protein [Halobaculum rubrum]QZX99266.1 TOBE domain-containing protein [Halobaculum rubrum]